MIQQKLLIGSRIVYILDEVISSDTTEKFYQYVRGLSFLKQERDNIDDKFPSFSADLKPRLFEINTIIGKVARELINKFYPDKDYILFRVAVNMMTRGDMELPHSDCQPHRDDITILYYVNNVWDYKWGGETLFFLDNDSQFGVLPRPGRFVVFPGVVEHKAGIPSRNCTNVRYSLALKYASRNFVNFKTKQKF